MNSKNKFKNSVIAQAIKNGANHTEAVKQVERTFRFYPSREYETFDHCGFPDCLCGNNVHTAYQAEAYGATVGNVSYGGDEYGNNQMWPTAYNDGSIAATIHIRSF